jgi:hypothetical protein
MYVICADDASCDRSCRAFICECVGIEARRSLMCERHAKYAAHKEMRSSTHFIHLRMRTLLELATAYARMCRSVVANVNRGAASVEDGRGDAGRGSGVGGASSRDRARHEEGANHLVKGSRARMRVRKRERREEGKAREIVAILASRSNSHRLTHTLLASMVCDTNPFSSSHRIKARSDLS